MSMLALRLAAHANGVSELHARVTRRMWRNGWPGLPESEVPIGSVSNGVHYRSWISLEFDELYERYLGRRWRQEPADRECGSGRSRSRPRSCGASTRSAATG